MAVHHYHDYFYPSIIFNIIHAVCEQRNHETDLHGERGAEN